MTGFLITARPAEPEMEGKKSCSFLKKRTKKLLSVSGSTEFSRLGTV
jgi:hypothetical protein